MENQNNLTFHPGPVARHLELMTPHNPILAVFCVADLATQNTDFRA
jgi:hypothetical protein